MTRAATSRLVAAARSAGRGIGAFNVVHLESAEAIVAGAEAAGLPVIMQISQNCAAFHGTLEPLASACRSIAAAADVEVALHLDHATDRELVDEAFALGFDSVMFDGAELEYAANVSATREVVAQAHRRGLSVEAELGEIGGKDGAHAPWVRTDAQEAAEFSAATGVDALAVAVGSSHAMRQRSAQPDHELISRIAEKVEVPLVLHGSSGVPDDELVRAVRAGMTKINVSTHLNAAFTGALRRRLAEQEHLVDSRKYLGPAREAFAAEVEHLLTLFAAGRVLTAS